MRQIIAKTGLILAALLVGFYVIPGCEDAKNPMTEHIVDMNDNIASVDKEVAQPGDIVTFTGTDLDRVYKILLNEDVVPVVFEATSTELKMTVPSLAPLGDIVTISLFFSGKGLAQTVIKLISPPVIVALSPAAAEAGDELSILGRELYLTRQVKIGDAIIDDFTLVDDKKITVTVPEGFTGGDVAVISETGAESLSPYPLVKGIEILVTNFDDASSYFTSISSNGNMDQDIEETGDFPRNKYWTFTITDNNTSWGGNIDFYTQNLPAGYDNDDITLMIDIKLSSAMNVNIMVQGPSNVFGRTYGYQAGWQTVSMPFTEMGTGYGGGEPYGQVDPFDELNAVKVQPPASANDANFGETVSVDNIKFIIITD